MHKHLTKKVKKLSFLKIFKFKLKNTSQLNYITKDNDQKRKQNSE